MSFRTNLPFDDPHQQLRMIHDVERTTCLASAIRDHVSPGSVVVDLGSGSGILAVIAAKCGARRVYAVEQTNMADAVGQLARENQLTDTIRVLRKDAMNLVQQDFDEPPTLLISETLGNFAGGENIHGLCGHVRSLFPEVLVVPSRYRLYFTPIDSHYFRKTLKLDDVQGVSMAQFGEWARCTPTCTYVSAEELAGPSLATEWCNVSEPLPPRYAGSIRARHSFSAIAVTWEAEFSQRARFRTSLRAGASHWLPYLFPLSTRIQISEERDFAFEIRTNQKLKPIEFAWCLDPPGQVIASVHKAPMQGLESLLERYNLRRV